MLTEDFIETILDTISYCEDYLSFLKANNIFVQ